MRTFFLDLDELIAAGVDNLLQHLTAALQHGVGHATGKVNGVTVIFTVHSFIRTC